MCPRRIEEDHQQFRDVVGGKIRKELKKFIKTGKIFKNRGKNGKISISIPRIDIPHIVYGENNSGVGRGDVKPGDVIGKDKKAVRIKAIREGRKKEKASPFSWTWKKSLSLCRKNWSCQI